MKYMTGSDARNVTLKFVELGPNKTTLLRKKKRRNI